MEACPEELVAFADRLADIAGEILRGAFHRPVEIERKADGTPVTNIDRAVEAAVRAEIERRYPGHGIRGEEFPAARSEAEFVWIIDPLDGTKEFIQGLPLFGFLLGLVQRGDFALGLAEQPVTRDRWLAAAGHGARLNSAPIATRRCSSLAEATVSIMGYDSFCPAHHDRLAAIGAAAKARVIADSFYVFGLLATGRVDAIVSAGFALHDYAALEVIVREAGGAMTDWAGRRLGLSGDGTVVAVGDPALLPDILVRIGA
ncbi:MAG TPA: inositol monophosphatase family protein [Stellaceae bacterium]|nr:inositol monophosphatase family protein [Stellaceae bacterium]